MQKLKSKFKSFLNTFNFLFLFLTFAFLLLPLSKVHASDFKTEYQVEYNLSQTEDDLNSQVNFKIKITNLKSDIYVNKFAVSFPNTFSINNLKAFDDNGFIAPKVVTDDTKTKVELEFSNPAIGKDSVNTFILNFGQANLFKINGNIWEVVLPVIENSKDESYQIIVNLPEITNKKISIAKPKPDLINGTKIIWNNPKTKTIYAVFGDNQIYEAELIYHLKNDQIYPIFTEIAFPPETINQKIFIRSILPGPESVRRDEDGNYLGKYFLKPLETKTVVYKGLIEIYAKPREEAIKYFRDAVKQQKNYLLTAKKYWQINIIDSIKNINEPKDIYDFVVNHLSYNYGKINSQNKRLGADFVLTHPDQAVCLEFTDLFIGITREKGIFSREVEGYGFSLDPRLQPLSLSSDILHAWPEYYDAKTENWVSVDPTWENTSGIDYFTSFDLNHIVFAIHGKNPDYPLPAGMYKIENSRDISIKPTTNKPSEKKEIILEGIDILTTISDKKDYQGKFVVKNNGSSYLWNIPVEIKAENLIISVGKINVPVLAPKEKKQISFNFLAKNKNRRIQGKLIVDVFEKQLLEQKINVILSVYTLVIKIFAVLLGLSLLFLVYRFLTNIRRHDH